MPTATDLVTDLPADFAVFGQAVDTSMAGLKGGTTGQILSKTSATDMAFTWVSANPGDITGVTAGTGISGGGTSGDVTVTNSMATAMTTSGDLIQATGSGTFARLGTGTSGQFLTTNGTTNSWATPSAGSLTLLSTTTLSGASTTISSISQSYKNLYIITQGVLMNGAANIDLLPNNAANGTYSYVANATVANGNNNNIFLSANSGILATGGLNAWSTTIYNYTSTSYHKTFNWNGVYVSDASLNRSIYGGGGIRTTSAITSLVFACGGGQLFTGGQVLIYGVN
jgi:hypothetical protein